MFLNSHTRKMQTSKNSEEYGALDLFRMASAILVMCIHFRPFFDYSDLLNFCISEVISRIAVPFFFMCSGFFMGKKIRLNDGKDFFYLKQSIKKLLLLLVFWNLVYLPFNIRDIITYQSGGTVYKLLLFLRKMIMESYGHLWYLNSLFMCLVSLYIWRKFKYKDRYLIILMLGLYTFGLLGSSYFFVAEKMNILSSILVYVKHIIINYRNLFFFGGIFYMVGYKLDLISLKKRFSGLLTIILFITFFVECYFIKINSGKSWDYYITLLPLTIAIFLLLKEISIQNCVKIREISSLCYFMHPLIGLIFGPFIYQCDSAVRFIMLLILTITISIIVRYMGGKFHYLKVLF